MKYAVGNRVSVEVSKGSRVVGEVVNCIPGSANADRFCTTQCDDQPMYDVRVPQVSYTHDSPEGTCTGSVRTLAFFEDELQPVGGAGE